MLDLSKRRFSASKGSTYKIWSILQFWIWPLINVSGPKFDNKLVFDTLKIIWELYDGYVWKSLKMVVFTKNVFGFPAIPGGGVELNLTIRHSYENSRKDVLYECQTCSIVILYEIYIAPNRPGVRPHTKIEKRADFRWSSSFNFYGRVGCA